MTDESQRAILRPWTTRALVPTLVAVGLLVAIVSSLGAPLIPEIAHHYHVSLSSAQWVLTAALLTGALTTPLLGRLADGTRQRDLITITLVAVLAGCILSGIGATFSMVVLGRALQGMGFGLLPVNMATARRLLPPAAARQAIATLSVSTAIGAGLGYPLTAGIAQEFGISAAYWFGAITVCLALTAALIVLPGRTPSASISFDALGAVVLSFMVTAISLVLAEGDSWGWTSTTTLSLIIVAATLLVPWIVFELRQHAPLLNLRHLTNPTVAMANAVGFLMSASMYLVVPVVVEFIQSPADVPYGFHSTVLVSGLVLMPLSAATFLSSRLLIPYERRFGIRTMVPLGALVFGAAAAFFALFHTQLWEAFATMGVLGLGIGFTFSAIPGFIVRAVPAHETGAATGLYQVLRTIGLSFGSALSAGVLASFTSSGSVFPTVHGFLVTLIIALGLALIAAVASYLLAGPQPPSDALQATLDQRMVEEAELEAGGAFLDRETSLDATDPSDER